MDQNSSRLSRRPRVSTFPPVPVALEVGNLRKLGEMLAFANTSGQRIASFDLRRLNRVIEYAPQDMTVTVEAGITLESLQKQLAAHGQWLPIDAPQPERATMGAILATNTSGSRRFGYGTVRDWLIGMRVMLADGTVIKSGGKVVKNVAGYDLAKLFIGSRGTLGIIVEATFKLRPRPEREAFVQRAFAQLEEATRLTESVVESNLNPIVIDLHSLSSQEGTSSSRFSVVLGLAGASEDVEYELRQAAELGVQERADLHYQALFWSNQFADLVRKRSVLPSNLGEALRELGDVPFIACAGNGIVLYRGGPPPSAPDLPRHLFQRVKEAYDPKHIFPDFTV